MFLRIDKGDYLNLDNVSRIQFIEDTDSIKMNSIGINGRIISSTIYLKNREDDMNSFNKVITAVNGNNEILPDYLEFEYNNGIVRKIDNECYYSDINGNVIKITKEQFKLYYSIANKTKEVRDE